MKERFRFNVKFWIKSSETTLLCYESKDRLVSISMKGWNTYKRKRHTAIGIQYLPHALNRSSKNTPFFDTCMNMTIPKYTPTNQNFTLVCAYSFMYLVQITSAFIYDILLHAKNLHRSCGKYINQWPLS